MAGVRTEGSPPFWARGIAPQPCIRLDPRRIPTMKQPFAPAARLRGGGPILTTVLWTMFRLGSPPPRIEVPALAAQPAQKHAHQHHRIQPVRLCPPVFARDSDTRWMDDVRFDAARPEPPRQPETITAGLKGGGNARHRRPVFRCLVLPPLQQPKQRLLVRGSFFSGCRSTPGTIAATSQLDCLNIMTEISVRSCARGKRDRLRSLGRGVGRSIGCFQRRWCQPRRAPHSF